MIHAIAPALACLQLSLPLVQATPADLAIRDVTLFDSRNKVLLEHKTILIRGTVVERILDASEEVEAHETIAGHGRLAVPGFVDTHTHMKNVYGIGDRSEDFRTKESLTLDRNELSRTHLRFGTTTLVDMGLPEKLLPTVLEWQRDPRPEFPNLFVCGGALISDSEREPYVNHAEVADPEDARRKVREYAALGLKHLKLYSWLRLPEMEAIVAEALAEGLTVNGHIDRNGISIQTAMELGVRNFEHLLSLTSSVLDNDEHWERLNAKYGLPPMQSVDGWVASITFLFPYIRADPALQAGLEALLDAMAENGASLSTTVHQMAAVAGKTDFFTSFGGDDEQAGPSLPGYTDEDRRKLEEAYGVMMAVLKEAHDTGVTLRIGTDCRRGGEALLSELILLAEAGFPMKDVLQIATWNGAEALHLDEHCGSIEAGKQADLVLFDESPFENPRNVLAGLTVIKGGRVFESEGGAVGD